MENFNWKNVYIIALVIWVIGLQTSYSFSSEKKIFSLAYHDVVDKRDQLASDGVTLDTLVNHFEWLLVTGYQPVSIDHLLAARAGKRTLPEKPVLLCWDDGYKSFYTHVFPLLKAYKFPAVLALVGDWMSTDIEDKILYGSELISRKRFVTWEQVKEIDESGLVEIASHSMDMHKGILASPSGDLLPRMVARLYDVNTRQYETDAAYRLRLLQDFKANNQLIKDKLGKEPRVLVWPFGRYNEIALEIAKDTGFEITLSLDPVPSDINRFDVMGRIYPTMNPSAGIIRQNLTETNRPELYRFIKVDMGKLLEENTTNEIKFSALLERVQSLQVGAVLYEPTVTIDKKTFALFPNDTLDVIQDRLLRLTWHTERRGGAQSFLWLRKEFFTLDSDSNSTGSRKDSIFDALGKSSPGSGVLVDHEDFSKDLFSRYQNDPDKNNISFQANRLQKRTQRQEWLKTIADTGQLAQILSALERYQRWQPFQKIGLNVSGKLFTTITEKQLRAVLTGFDFLVIDLRTQQSDTDIDSLITFLERNRWLASYLSYLVPLLPYKAIDSAEDNRLANSFTRLTRAGMINHGYSDDFFLRQRPVVNTIRRQIAVSTFPVRP